MPLIAIATVAGLDRGEISALESLAIEMNSDPEAAGNARRIAIVHALRKYICEEECAVMKNHVVELLKIEDVIVSESEISSLLREWQIGQKSAQVGSEAAPRRCWILGPSVLAQIEAQLQGWSEGIVRVEESPERLSSVPESSEGITPQKPDYADYKNDDVELDDEAEDVTCDDHLEGEDAEEDRDDEEVVMSDDFDIADEEQEAIEAMVTWRERGEWPPFATSCMSWSKYWTARWVQTRTMLSGTSVRTRRNSLTWVMTRTNWTTSSGKTSEVSWHW
jgi:hypothetical protein